MSVYFHEEDLPEGALGPGAVAVDTETMGLNPLRDRLCLVQISDGSGDEHLVRFAPGSTYDAPVLKAILADPGRLKLFHFARFDIAALQQALGVVTTPVYCTKIASRLVRTYTDRHGLKELVRELLGQEVSKQQQSSDWGAAELSDAQRDYAASDVRFLHAMKDILGWRARGASSWRRPVSISCRRAPRSTWPAGPKPTFLRIADESRPDVRTRRS
jgi:ribonuclease D